MGSGGSAGGEGGANGASTSGSGSSSDGMQVQMRNGSRERGGKGTGGHASRQGSSGSSGSQTSGSSGSEEMIMNSDGYAEWSHLNLKRHNEEIDHQNEAAVCNICLIRQDHTSLWCEATSNLRKTRVESGGGDCGDTASMSGSSTTGLPTVGSGATPGDGSGSPPCVVEFVEEVILSLRPVSDGPKVEAQLGLKPHAKGHKRSLSAAHDRAGHGTKGNGNGKAGDAHAPAASLHAHSHMAAHAHASAGNVGKVRGRAGSAVGSSKRDGISPASSSSSSSPSFSTARRAKAEPNGRGGLNGGGGGPGRSESGGQPPTKRSKSSPKHPHELARAKQRAGSVEPKMAAPPELSVAESLLMMMSKK